LFLPTLFLQKGVTAREKSNKKLSREKISIAIDLSLKNTLMMSSAFFLNWFPNFQIFI